MKQKAYRHVEILLLKVPKLPIGLKLSPSKTFMVGSHGNSHSIDQGKIYFKEEGFTFGYMVAKDTTLLHPEHKDETGGAKIPNGVYKLIKQNEYTPDGLVPIID